MIKRVAMIIGSSGLVGSCLLDELIKRQDIAEIRLLVRKPISQLPRKVHQFVTDFTALDVASDFFKVDVLYCCLGTTRKKTPNLQAYKAIDFGITMDVARRTKINGCNEVHLVSSVGANATSSNFYLRIKGETEEGLISLGFERCCIYRPSMLLGKRHESRPLERVAQRLMPIFDLLTLGGKYHSIEASSVARTMSQPVKVAGVVILEYQELRG
ncbi:MAG: nucleoside-diphosphate sugar epimerase [Bacteroidetes bacterium]|nr:nucleoside-diphosphate sugar epimerase [Bacteroidota bacterium]MBM3424009.1 nucleoside-diphosphate sugar epimerase [Bacteroidota bacterium]